MNLFQNKDGNYCLAICEACGYPHGIDVSWLNQKEPKTLECQCPCCDVISDAQLIEAKPV